MAPDSIAAHRYKFPVKMPAMNTPKPTGSVPWVEFKRGSVAEALLAMIEFRRRS
jgi:hypothetical protein